MSETNKAPGLVNWIGYLAITLLLILPLSILTVRSGAWQQGLILYALGCFGATLIMIVCILLLLLPRFAPWRSAILSRALFVLPGTVLLLMLVGGRGDYPPIHDISTDLEDPPVFSEAEARRGADSNDLQLDETNFNLQRAAYPDVQTLRVSLPLEEAFARAVKVAREMGWDIYREDLNAGVIEAVDTTAIMLFKDDVVIRLRSNAQGTLVDLRSVSRVGIGDIGANAKRIRAFSGHFEQPQE